MNDLKQLNDDDRAELAWALWDSLHEENVHALIPEWKKKLLDERLAYSLNNPNEGRPWREVMNELETRYKDV